MVRSDFCDYRDAYFCEGNNDFCYKDEINDDANENSNNNRINNNKTITSKSFEYNKKLIGSTPNNKNTLDTEQIFMV